MDAAQPQAGMHWWTVTTPLPVDAVARVMGGLGKPERPGRFGQPLRRVHESGTEVYCGSDRPGQPVVINAPGEVCEGWSKELLGWSRELGACCTRVDLALDVEPAHLSAKRLNQLRREFDAGRCKTSIRTRPCELHRNAEGSTIYLGGKSAELRIRIYDRRGPLRIEPQWRPCRSMGEQVPELLVTRGASHVWRSLARHAEFKVPWYRELLTGTSAELETEPRIDAALAQMMDQLNRQFGKTFWALVLLGVKLEDLQTVPDKLRGSQAAKFLSWCKSAEGHGYDPEKLRREVKRLCK